jgi:hypothetical protein
LANYGAAYLWMVFLHEHYGGVATIAELISQQANGINGVNAVLSSRGFSENFNDVFSDWKIANYLDDKNFGSGRYAYTSLDVKLKSNINHSQLPISNTSRTVQSFAADYIEFAKNNEVSGINIKINPRRSLGKFDVRVISMMAGKAIAIDTIPLDTSEGSITISSFGYNVDKVILVTSWYPETEADFGDTASYTYSANPGGEIGFIVTILPNAVNKRYIDIVAKLVKSESVPTAGVDMLKITIKKQGKIIVNGQPMNTIGKTVFIYQFYIPDGLNSGDVRWEIVYLNQLISSGSIQNNG